MAEGSEQAPVIGPVHPFEGGEFDCLAVTPRAAPAAFAGTLTPYGGVGLSGGGGRDLRLGVRFLRGTGFELALEGERRAGRAERAGHGLMLRGRMHW